MQPEKKERKVVGFEGLRDRGIHGAVFIRREVYFASSMHGMVSLVEILHVLKTGKNFNERS